MPDRGKHIPTAQAATHVRQTHPCGFRSGEWARLLTTVQSHGRDCWLVQFEDKATDWWPISDALAGYEFEARP